MDNTEIKSKLKTIIALFVNCDYELLSTLDTAHTSAKILKEIIDDYGGILTMPPDNVFKTLYVVDMENEDANPPSNRLETIYLFNIENEDSTIEYAIEFNFWFDNEPSDLTLKITIFNSDNFEITDIRIL